MLFFINGTTNALEPMFDTLANISVSSSTAPANGLYLASTNTPTIAANSLPVVWFQSAASSVNYFLILGQATGQAPAISVLGADSNISMNFGTKGTGAFNFYTNSTAQQFSITHVASAVNYISVNGKQAGSDPNLSVVGADTNISLVLSSKGTGSFSFQSAAGEQFGITNTSSVVNRLRVTGSATGGSVSIFINGTDSNVGILYNSKGTGAHAFYTNGGSQQQFGITHVASAVNYISVSGNVTGSGPVIAVLGSDSNVSFSYNAKGTGSHTFYTGGGSYTQFQILNTTNAVNYLTVFGNATGGSPFIQAAGSDTDVGIVIYAKNGGNIAIGTNGITLLKVGGDSTVAINTAQLATNATNGFLWITSSAGAPTGVATAPYTGACALHYDATNNKIYVRSGGTWRSTAALT